MSRKLLKVIGKGFLISFLVISTFLLTTVSFLVFTSRFSISGEQISWFKNRYLSQALDLQFAELGLELERVPESLLAKRISLQGKDLCVSYKAKTSDALRFCFSEVSLAATLGWGSGSAKLGDSPFLPRLFSLEPVRLIQGNGFVDLTAFQTKEKKPEPTGGGFSYLEFLKHDVWRRWQVGASRIEVEPLRVVLNPDSSLQADVSLSTLRNGKVVRAALSRLRSEQGGLQASFVSEITRMSDQYSRVQSTGRVDLAKRREIHFDSEAKVFSSEKIEFQATTRFRGLAALRELRLEGLLNNGEKTKRLDGKLSVKAGNRKSGLEALDFVDCDVDADLIQKTGGVRCGPQKVRLALKQRRNILKPRLFVLAPEFDLRIENVLFGDERSADFRFDMSLDHIGFITAETKLGGRISLPRESGLQYKAEGKAQVTVQKFSQVVKLLNETPYSVPAPFNVLDGAVTLSSDLSTDSHQGELRYQASTQLDSRYESVYLRLNGATEWEQDKNRIRPATQAVVYIDRLHLSAPRLEMRAPPQMRPDQRFGPITEEKLRILDQDFANVSPGPAMDIRLQVRTTKPGAIRIATNMTKEPVPIEMNLTYVDSADRPPRVFREDSQPSIASVVVENSAPTSKISGWVGIGETRLDIFRRNATMEGLRVSFNGGGQPKFDGQVRVEYLDYKILIKLQGAAPNPLVHLSSEPPLEENQIVSVLVFGRPLNELGDDEKSSVSNLNAAFANAALGISSLYLLASTPIESVGYDPDRSLVTAKVGLGEGRSVEIGGGADRSSVGFQQRLTREFSFRSEVERIGTTGKRTVSALVEWVRRF